jgi:hypothetical protein
MPFLCQGVLVTLFAGLLVIADRPVRAEQSSNNDGIILSIPPGTKLLATLEDKKADAQAAPATPQEEVVGIMIDPTTGNMTIESRNADGTTTVSVGQRAIDEDGVEYLVEVDEKGNRREAVILPDGTVNVTRSNGAEESLVTLSPSGGVSQTERDANGALTHTRRDPDGSVTTEHRDSNGELKESTTLRPDGWMDRIDSGGNLRSSMRDADGNTTTIEVEGDGSGITTVTDAQGNAVRRESDRVTEPEPGRRYFEEVLGGTDWNSLPPRYKSLYANSERQIHQSATLRAKKDAENARRRENDARRAAEAERSNTEREKKLAALRDERLKLDRRAAALLEKEERQRMVEASYEKGNELRRMHDAALARGDQAEAARIAGLMDQHHEASMVLLQPTPEEQREIDRLSDVRHRLAVQVRAGAMEATERQLAYDTALQDTKESLTNVTKWVSLGSQMQQDTARTTRMADRERAGARATQEKIQRMLSRTGHTAEERRILSQMEDLARLKEQGASKLLADNARITTAGYAIDAALTATGGKLIQGGVRGAASLVPKSVSAPVAAIVAKATPAKAAAIARAAAQLGNRGVLEVAGAGATRVVTGATRQIAGEEAAKAAGRILRTDVSSPALQAAERAARRVVGDRVADAVGAGAKRAGMIAATDVRELPGLVRGAVTGKLPSAEVGAAGHTAREIAESTAPRPKSPAEMSRAERQAYNDALADEAVRRALKEKPPAETDELARSITDGNTEAIKKPSEMSRAEQQAYNDRRANRAVREAQRNRRISETEDDILPGPAEPHSLRPFTPEEVKALHTQERALTPNEIQRKAEIYRERERARLASKVAAAEGRPVAEVQERARHFQDLDRMIHNGRGTRIERAPATGGRVGPGQKPGDTQGFSKVLPPPRPDAKVPRKPGSSQSGSRKPGAEADGGDMVSRMDGAAKAPASPPTKTRPGEIERRTSPETRSFETATTQEPGTHLPPPSKAPRPAEAPPRPRPSAADELRLASLRGNERQLAEEAMKNSEQLRAQNPRLKDIPEEDIERYIVIHAGREGATSQEIAAEALNYHGARLTADELRGATNMPIERAEEAIKRGWDYIGPEYRDRFGTKGPVRAPAQDRTPSTVAGEVAAKGSMTDTLPLAPGSRTGPNPTEILPPHVSSEPLHGNPTMDLDTLRSFAATPRVRTVSDPQRIFRFSDLRKFDDPVSAIQARSQWLRVPETRKAAIDNDLRAAIDEAAAIGDKWARRLQSELNAGTFNFSYEPGIRFDGLATNVDHVVINPLSAGNPRTGDELASILIHEYVHTFRGPRKWAADYKPDFVGVPDVGKYNEVRAFLAEAIFNRNLARARQLNGKPLDPTAANLLNRYMNASGLAAEAPGMARGQKALGNLQEHLVDRIYGPKYKDNPALAAERLAAFRGGSMANIQKYIREKIQGGGDPDQIMKDLLETIDAEGGRFLPHGGTP